jgi:hypothetical protein
MIRERACGRGWLRDSAVFLLQTMDSDASLQFGRVLLHARMNCRRLPMKDCCV